MDVLIPDIGDFEEVDVIEILVSVGDKISIETPLMTLESDKATCLKFKFNGFTHT